MNRRALFGIEVTLCAAMLLVTGAVQAERVRSFPLDDMQGLDARGINLKQVIYQGHPALRLTEIDQGTVDAVVIIDDSDFTDGTISVELAGHPRADADPNMRGFVGIAFRLQEGEELHYECFYLRPTNGRANAQIRRNHTTQYVSHPEYTWHRLRGEKPGVYESYVDVESGAWTPVKIEVDGRQARLYVNGAEQPSLVVSNLLGDPSSGAVALWIGQGTEAHFRNLTIVDQGPE